MRLFFRVIIIVLVLVAGMLLGFTAANALNQKITAHNTVYIPQNCYIRVPNYFDVRFLTSAIPVETKITVEEVQQVEVVKEVPVELDDWTSTEELERFLAADDTDRHIILAAGPDGVVQLNGRCEDIALQLRDRAMAQGKYLSVQILHSEEYYKWYGKRLPQNNYHAVCMARIDQNFYIIEPDTDKYWLAYGDD